MFNTSFFTGVAKQNVKLKSKTYAPYYLPVHCITSSKIYKDIIYETATYSNSFSEPSKENNESSQSILHKDFSMSEAFGENTLQTIDEDKELTFNANPVDEAVQQGNKLMGFLFLSHINL